MFATARRSSDSDSICIVKPEKARAVEGMLSGMVPQGKSKEI
jgi:hypothetical protein